MSATEFLSSLNLIDDGIYIKRLFNKLNKYQIFDVNFDDLYMTARFNNVYTVLLMKIIILLVSYCKLSLENLQETHPNYEFFRFVISHISYSCFGSNIDSLYLSYLNFYTYDTLENVDKARLQEDLCFPPSNTTNNKVNRWNICKHKLRQETRSSLIPRDYRFNHRDYPSDFDNFFSIPRNYRLNIDDKYIFLNYIKYLDYLAGCPFRRLKTVSGGGVKQMTSKLLQVNKKTHLFSHRFVFEFLFHDDVYSSHEIEMQVSQRLYSNFHEEYGRLIDNPDLINKKVPQFANSHENILELNRLGLEPDFKGVKKYYSPF